MDRKRVPFAYFAPILLLCFSFAESSPFPLDGFKTILAREKNTRTLVSEARSYNTFCKFVVFNVGNSKLEATVEGANAVPGRSVGNLSANVDPHTNETLVFERKKNDTLRCRVFIRNLDSNRHGIFFVTEAERYAPNSSAKFKRQLSDSPRVKKLTSYSRGSAEPETRRASLSNAREELLKNILVSELSRASTSTPFQGPSLSFVFDLFRPERSGTNVWDEIGKNAQQSTIDPLGIKIVLSVFDAKLATVIKQMNRIRVKLNSPASVVPTKTSRKFISLASLLSGMEAEIANLTENPSAFVPGGDGIEKGDFDEEDDSVMAMPLLPLYSTFVTMMMLFYEVGLSGSCRKKLNLSSVETQQLVEYQTLALNRSKTFIDGMEKRMIGVEMKLDSLTYAGVIEQKNFFSLHGHEYVAIWESMIARRTTKNQTFSGPDFTGATLFWQPFVSPYDMMPKLFEQMFHETPRAPLVPEYADKSASLKWRQNKMVEVCVNVHKSGSIVGVRIGFGDGKKYALGKKKNTRSPCVDLADERTYLSSVLVEGWPNDVALIARLQFTLSNGTAYDFRDYDYDDLTGTMTKSFDAKEGYQIVGMYGDSYWSVPGDKLVNVQFSYQRLSDESTARADADVQQHLRRWRASC